MAETAASPRASHVLMAGTYLIGIIGAFIGFMALSSGADAALMRISAVLAVGVPGLLSFVRHAVFNRSDAVAGGWDYGQVNNFQIEVGLANLAWGVFAILAVLLDWGTQAIAASFLISGFYFAAVAVFVIVTRDFRNRRIGGLIGIVMWGAINIWLGWGFMAMA